VRNVACMGEMRNTYRISEEKRPFGRPRSRWQDNIRNGRRETEWEGVWTVFIWLKKGTSGGALWTR